MIYQLAQNMDLSADELLDRKNTLKQFENYFSIATNALKNCVDKIGWSLDDTPKNESLVRCPFNSEHRLPPSKLDDHCQACLLKQNGYNSTHSLYPSYNYSTKSAQTIQIDKTTQMNILKSAYEESNCTLNIMIKESVVQDILNFHYVLQKNQIKLEPREVSQSIEHYVSDFTPDERRVLYDYAVKNTKLPDHDFLRNDLAGIDVFNKTIEKPKTELELLQEQRDLKRRRAAYRGKRVHTDRKSYVEVVREVVEGLTSSLSQKDSSTSSSIEISKNTPETVSNNRLVYKYEGNRNYVSNPYTRWVDIKKEESQLFKYYERNSNFLSQNTTDIRHSKDSIDIRKPRRSRSRSRGRRLSISKEQFMRSKRSRSHSQCKSVKYINYKRSRSPLITNEYQSKKPKIRSKSKEMFRNRPMSADRKHTSSKKHATQSQSKQSLYRRSRSKSISVEYKHKKSRRHRTRSTSSEYDSRKKLKHSTNPSNYYKALQSNERNNDFLLKSRKDYKKKNKHKKSKKHSKSPGRFHKS